MLLEYTSTHYMQIEGEHPATLDLLDDHRQLFRQVSDLYPFGERLFYFIIPFVLLFNDGTMLPDEVVSLK